VVGKGAVGHTRLKMSVYTLTSSTQLVILRPRAVCTVSISAMVTLTV
jgi:hypothetical protein